ncbi:sensor domain-containing diguanylate cyclase [Janthinobacterium sp. 17J80-10]|uniref:sensor domain-containing diguanylate cyclase n=1 Tax=Janthinobacterium sp. 17J80-10 TaxID=2497863 RepID=UPI001005698C|nr:sensor domain-containing diguanylate cyclase [Janthinobacterium sp. 17J80-10]QAU33555.1 sensor domain-containing diguanylate cyclase [Janthinobacterium sp. 17J80-10]
MAFIAEQHRNDIYRRLSQTSDLDKVLDLLEEEVQCLAVVDGFIINLHDVRCDNLVSLKVRFTPEFQFLNDTYIGYRISLDSGFLNARAFRSRQVMSTDAETADEQEKKLLATWNLTDMTALPLLDPQDSESAALGTLLLLSCSGPVFDEAQAVLLELMAIFYRPIANAHEHALCKAEFQRAQAVTAEHDRFLQFIVEINNLTSPQKIYELFRQELFRNFGFEMVSFFMLKDDVLVGEYMAVSDPVYEDVRTGWYEFSSVTAFSADSSDGGVPHVFCSDSSLLFRDVQQIMSLPMSAKDRRLLSVMGTMRTLLMLPIRYQHRPIGVISLCTLSEQIEVSESDIRLLGYLAAFLGTAITNSKHFEVSQAQNREIERLNLILQDKVDELSHQVSIDRLTGLYNFRTFQQELARRVGEARRGADQLGLSIIVADIDHFKQFNDTYGHGAGNDMLAAVARELAALARAEDMACRYGGEEFVVILPCCDQEGALQFAERVRLAVEHMRVPTHAGLLSVTVSLGSATHLPNESEEEFFQRADQALYLAKKKGRNCVEFS